MCKFAISLVFIILLSFKFNCYSLILNRDGSSKIFTDAAYGINQNSGRVRVIRQTLGYPSPVQSRDQTVIVVPNTGTNTPYRTLPTYNNNNRAPTVIVNLPEDNSHYPTSVGRRYIGRSNT